MFTPCCGRTGSKRHALLGPRRARRVWLKGRSRPPRAAEVAGTRNTAASWRTPADTRVLSVHASSCPISNPLSGRPNQTSLLSSFLRKYLFKTFQPGVLEETFSRCDACLHVAGPAQVCIINEALQNVTGLLWVLVQCSHP
jgi:hypothetical protein